MQKNQFKSSLEKIEKMILGFEELKTQFQKLGILTKENIEDE